MGRRSLASYGLAALLLFVSAPAALAAGTGVTSVTVEYDVTGNELRDPCTNEVLGTYTSGTVTVTERSGRTATGTYVHQRTYLWTNVVAVAADGTTYRVQAVIPIWDVLDGGTWLQYAYVSMLTILGPDGVYWQGVVTIHVGILADGTPTVDFERAASDAWCW